MNTPSQDNSAPPDPVAFQEMKLARAQSEADRFQALAQQGGQPPDLQATYANLRRSALAEAGLRRKAIAFLRSQQQPPTDSPQPTPEP